MHLRVVFTLYFVAADKTSKSHPVISALISSYFCQPNEYFMVFTFPEVRTTLAAGAVSNDDHSLSPTVGTRINDVFARLHTRKIFLAGMTEAQKSYIRAYFPDSYLIEIDSVDDVARIPSQPNRPTRSQPGFNRKVRARMEGPRHADVYSSGISHHSPCGYSSDLAA